MTRCSVVIPVCNQAALTRQCVDLLLAQPEVGCEIIVVDDVSTDETPQVLASYGNRIRVVERVANGGFAAACNDGAAAASGEYLVFLNNDTRPIPGWLAALVRYADDHPRAALVGCKLLFPDGTVQHAGVAICQDRYPRHLYVGFPADHPAVNRSRRFQVASAACALVRASAFREAGGFDVSYRNGYEDVDLCLRLGARGHEVHYCHESVVYHLEGQSGGRRQASRANAQLYRARWARQVQPDDLQYYVADGLLTLGYPADSYPLRLEVSPWLATVKGDDRAADRLLHLRSRQVAVLLREVVRLLAHVQESNGVARATAEVDGHRAELSERWDALVARLENVHESPCSTAYQTSGNGQAELLRRDEELMEAVCEVEALLADPPDQSSGEGCVAHRGFAASRRLRYECDVRAVRELVQRAVPAGAKVLVVSRGDDELLERAGRCSEHFPQDGNSAYLGHSPADSAQAIAHLEELRTRGADFLLFPPSASWWLEHYADFKRHLEDRYVAVSQGAARCTLFALRPAAGAAQEATMARAGGCGS
jgi:GT2 family glycosyltransferase